MTKNMQKGRSLGLFWEARTRILAWYLVLMTFFVAVSIPAFRQFLFARVNARVQEDMLEQMQRFDEFLEQWDDSPDRLPTDTTADLIDEFLYIQPPDDDVFLIALRDGQLYRSSPAALPTPLKAGSPLLDRLAHIDEHVEGQDELPESQYDSVLYLADPLEDMDDDSDWTFIVAHTTAGERDEAVEAVIVIIQVMIVVLLLALVLAWFVAGRVLLPLRLLAQTAQSISESDLNQRIPSQGSGELAELATTFNSMLDRLQSAFVSQRNFIDDAGHELRTPITIIQGHLELLSDDPQEQEETFALVHDELDRMSRLVEDLLLLAKAERPDFLMLETVDLQTVMQELYSKARALAPRNWQLESEARGRLVGDRQRLTQAIINLAQNAVEHTTDGGTITLGSSLEKGVVRVWVHDTGEGIPLQDQDKIFERFARINHRRRSEGAGLGLSIVRAIAEAHGGRVELLSRPGVGSTFTIVIPLDPPKGVMSYESNPHR